MRFSDANSRLKVGVANLWYGEQKSPGILSGLFNAMRYG